MTYESGVDLTVAPPARIPWFLRPALAIARRLTGKDPLPGRLLAHAPKAALAAGLLEALSAHAPGDLDARTLKLARLSASLVTGCPFCIDMNTAEYEAAGLDADAVAALHAGDDTPFDARERAAIGLARAMSRTPAHVPAAVRADVAARFTPREVIVLVTVVAQVNYWARLNQALGVPALGFVYAPGDTTCSAPP